jgi:hypothetical protein
MGAANLQVGKASQQRPIAALATFWREGAGLVAIAFCGLLTATPLFVPLVIWFVRLVPL